ncbi:hypothetical protein GN956_G74 [Arapaima gigas]
MLNDRIIWRNFPAPTTALLAKFPANVTSDGHLLGTTVAPLGRPDPRLPSFSAYLGLFVCLLLFLLALLIVMLYRMKHTIAPLPSDVESARHGDMFPEVELCTFNCAATACCEVEEVSSRRPRQWLRSDGVLPDNYRGQRLAWTCWGSVAVAVAVATGCFRSVVVKELPGKTRRDPQIRT